MNSTKKDISICWFRRDLRMDDHTALHHALKSPYPVLALFIFDSNILDKLENKFDRRVDFIHQALTKINENLTKKGSHILIKIGNPLEIFNSLMREYNIKEIHLNEDYEPYAIQRDSIVETWAKTHHIVLKKYTDQVIFAPGKILKSDDTPYTVYTPFSKKWKLELSLECLIEKSINKTSNFLQISNIAFPSLEEIGFKKTGLIFSTPDIQNIQLQAYKENRDYPYLDSTSRVSTHLRFGTISIRKLVKYAVENNESYLNELIWREFFMHILYFFPKVENESFQAKFRKVVWSTNMNHFKRWCEGNTGYPIVDAGMRELAATGYMHNRVRMITANFLTKILFIDWRLGEKWFADKLDDYDLALNNGNWQWAAGSGCDAAPYFRIFNPTEQIKKFDSELKYIRQWVPEFESLEYSQQVVDYKIERDKYLKEMAKQLKE